MSASQGIMSLVARRVDFSTRIHELESGPESIIVEPFGDILYQSIFKTLKGKGGLVVCGGGKRPKVCPIALLYLIWCPRFPSITSTGRLAWKRPRFFIAFPCQISKESEVRSWSSHVRGNLINPGVGVIPKAFVRVPFEDAMYAMFKGQLQGSSQKVQWRVGVVPRKAKPQALQVSANSAGAMPKESRAWRITKRTLHGRDGRRRVGTDFATRCYKFFKVCFCTSASTLMAV